MKKSLFLMRILILSCIILIILIASTIFTTSSKSKNEIKYATDYPLNVSDTVYALDSWEIEKCQNDNGDIFLTLRNTSEYSSNEPIDHFDYCVYDSASIAKKVYDNRLDDFLGYGCNKILEQGENWALLYDSNICDAIHIDWMCYLKDNIIIDADLEVDGSSIQYYSDENGNSHSLDAEYLKKYIINNSSKIRDYIINDVLTAETIDTNEYLNKLYEKIKT